MISDVSFEILSKCPNNCLYCSSCSSTEEKDIFSFDVIRDVVWHLAKLPVKRICLSGGEPFLHDDLLAIVEIITKSGITCDIYSAGITIEDHAISAITRDQFAKLRQGGLNRIMFNLQAIDESKYDLIMGTTGRQQYLFTSIQNAVECGIETEIHFVPMTHNVDQIDKVLTYADSQNIKRVSFLKLVRHGRAEHNGLELSIQDEIAVCQKLANLAKFNPKIRIGIPLIFGKTVASCHAICDKIYIKYDGSVYGCEAFKYVKFDDVEVPNVHANNIQFIISNSQYFENSKQLLDTYKCGDNSCPVQNYMRTGGMSNG